MFLSVFDMFKIGIGPSSSHTVGPMVAGARFLALLRQQRIDGLARVRVTLYGSLAFTGRGHHTDKAVILGLMDQRPDEVDPAHIEAIVGRTKSEQQIKVAGLPAFRFGPDEDIIFDYVGSVSDHPNSLSFRAFDAQGALLLEQVYLSVGGGFVETPQEHQLGQAAAGPGALPEAASGVPAAHPFPFSTAAEMLSMGVRSGLSIAELKRANESVTMGESALDERLDVIWAAMQACMERGLSQEGVLPGGLRVIRRAPEIYRRLQSKQGHNNAMEHAVMDWLGVYAMAVNEENAAGGRVVTSPTNGAAGVIPAVLRYYQDHCQGAGPAGVRTFLLTAAAIGGIIKHNASISGAEVGCQGEVGSASAMAAAGLCAALGGGNLHIENAAEIALEHHLGMTCDPIGGLVQVPCIERNGFGAVKAVTAASLALHGDGQHIVSLDNCIETMRQTGLDMSGKYKETSTGGLAVNVPQC